MGILDSIFGGLSEDRKAKEDFALKVKEAGRAYIIDTGKYVSGPFVTEAAVMGTVYVNKRGFFYQAVPASKCIIIYTENIKSMEIINGKKKNLKIEYNCDGRDETLIMELSNPEGCLNELKRSVEDYRLEKQKDPSILEKEVENTEVNGDLLSTIEKLAVFRDKGIISEEEFQSKKKELLGRL